MKTAGGIRICLCQIAQCLEQNVQPFILSTCRGLQLIIVELSKTPISARTQQICSYTYVCT